MANTRISLPLQQVLSSGGKPIVGAKLYVYATGTTTLLTTYTNPTLTTTNTNPLVADANGIFGEVFGAIGITYDFVYKTASDVLIKTFTGITNSSMFDANGNMKVDTAIPDDFHIIQKSGVSESTGTGNGVVAVIGGRSSSAPSITIYGTNSDDANAVSTGIKVRKNSVTNRSINTVGTVNTSGADYAEYCKKSPTCGAIAKGDVIGRDINGELTQKFNESLSFCIKSTDPSFVGNDVWGRGLSPTELDIERVKHDRIAFSGQAPVNHAGVTFSVGEFVKAVSGVGDSIKTQFIASPTIADLPFIVGRVVATAPDNRPIVKVM